MNLATVHKVPQGFHQLQLRVLDNDIYACPYVEECEGSKDPEFYLRCEGPTLPYVNCLIYRVKESDDSQIVPRRNGNLRARTLPHHLVTPATESVEDALNDGVDILTLPREGIRTLRNTPGYDPRSLWDQSLQLVHE
jgi:hypothetical protein